MTDQVQMRVTGLTIDPFTNMPIVILKDFDDKIALPIWIGLIEASSIATELEKMELSRPMTHDLMVTMIANLNGMITHVEINDLADNTFFAKVHLKSGKQIWELDCRPSDALALSLRTKSPIFVDRKVIEKSRKIESQIQSEDQIKTEKWTEILENLTSADFGKYKM